MSKSGVCFRLMATLGDKKRDKNLVEPEDVEKLSNIPYAATDKYNLLDIYYPKKAKGLLPVIVNIHGGGYVYGTKEVYLHYGMFLAQQGFVVVNFNYHLAPKYKFPVQLDEINQVLNWVEKREGKFHMDIKNVFLVGDSAGAQLTSHYSTIYSNPEFAKMYDFALPEKLCIRGIALNCGMYDITEQALSRNDGEKQPIDMADLMQDYLGKDRESIQEKLKVTQYITDQFPPTFVMTSWYDFLREKAKPMYELLKERGVQAEYKLYGEEGQNYMGHVFHCNMNLEEAKRCNLDEIEFFKTLICEE